MDELERLYNDWLDTIDNPEGDDYSIEDQQINDAFIHLLDCLHKTE